MNTIFYY